MLTRAGVCYDLKRSSFKYSVDGLTFVFSSQLHLDKFKQKYRENRDIINYSLSKRFNMDVSVHQLADIVLYRKIETRGFLVTNSEGKTLCLNNLHFNCGKMIFMNCNNLQNESTQK